MNTIPKPLGAIFIGILFCSVAQAKAWRGITPLKSTRADVERLLGKPGVHGRYQFKNERAYIYYAEGSCDKKDQRCECLISEDTVLNISVELETEMRFSKLRIDKSKYKKTYASNDPDLAVYANDEEGIIYDVSESNDDVSHIWYTASARDCEEIVRRHSRKVGGEPLTRSVLRRANDA